MTMYSYTNSKDEKIEVSVEHIETALKLKSALQKNSPSFRCSWATHKRMMEEEGYYDSENSERYRLFIKNHQDKFNDSEDVSTLESLKSAVGDMSYAKREVQQELAKLNKVKRSLSDIGIISMEIKESFKNIDWSFPDNIKESVKKTSDNDIIVVVSDWHIGATVKNNKGNCYNFTVAQERLNKYFDNIVKYAEIHNVKNVTVANTGDIIEGLYMRNFNQPYEAEFNLAEQISKATKLLMDFIIRLSSVFNVQYFGIAGNHDRWFFEKNGIDGDNAMKIVNESIKTIIELSDSGRLKYVEVEDEFNYEKVMKIGGKNFKFIHGDLSGRNPDIHKHIFSNQTDIDCLVMGHFHSYKMIESDYGKIMVTSGSLMGRNSYARKFEANTNASQTMIVVNENSIMPIRIDLQ